MNRKFKRKQSRRHFLKSIAFGTAAATFGGCGSWLKDFGRTDKRPNVVWILADDLGYGDLGCYGNEYIATPNLDKLAARGAMLTDFYMNAPVCTPSRAALLTGRCPQRNGLTNVIETTDRQTHLSFDEVLISDMMKEAGYRTGMVGKWHIGEVEGARPNDRGFDYFFGSRLGGIDFFDHVFLDGEPVLWENNDLVEQYQGQYITDVLGQKAVDFLGRQKSQPFFLYLSFFAVHTAMGPESRNAEMQAPKHWLDYYLQRGYSEKEAKYFGCASAMDEAVGKVIDQLEKSGQMDNTLILFSSDNGPDPREPGTAKPFQGTKHQLWEGGIREAMIAVWPGHIPSGNVYNDPAIATDWLPTTLAAAGLEPPAGVKLDGINILPLLTKGKPLPKRKLYWSYIRDTLRISREKAVRCGKWKWLNGELYDLENDPAEQQDIAKKYPDIAAKLEAAWNTWLRQFPYEQKRWGDRKPLRHE